MQRRNFLKSCAAGSLGAISRISLGQTLRNSDQEAIIWANLLHLGYNMWCDWDAPGRSESHTGASSKLRFDEKLWNDLLVQMADGGMNMLVIDLGEGVQYESHPELSVEGSWSPGRLREELVKLRGMGIEPIPKLNFSATHDAWLGPYSRCLSTEAYYSVCRELISEVNELFDHPRLFHLGMDEETTEHQHDFEYVVIRQHELWWNDFQFYVDQVEKCGSRPWIWSDYVWRHPDIFFKKMPKSVLQSNWYYGESFEATEDDRYVSAYRELEEHGYDQIPTGSNWSNNVNFGRTVEFARKEIPPPRLKGFLQAPWRPTLEQYREHHENAINQVMNAIDSWKQSCDTGRHSP